MRNGDATRVDIERAALHLFLRDGIAGASMRDIVRDAGISLGAVYNHYKSKDELAAELFSRGWRELAAEMMRRAAVRTGLHDKLQAMIGYLFESFDEDPDRIGYVFFSRHEHVRRIDARAPHPHGVIRRFVVDTMAKGEMRALDPDTATALIMGAVIQTIDAKMMRRIKGPLADRAAEVADACYRMVRK